MNVFDEKLASLRATVALAGSGPVERLSFLLEAGRGRRVSAVGSGGSAVAAEYLARCRATLALGPTDVLTPLDLVLNDVAQAEEIWLLSARGANPDIAAALRTALAGGIKVVALVAAPDSSLARDLPAGTGEAIAVPVAEEKDGFIATHSLIATITALLGASAKVAGGSAVGAMRRFGQGLDNAIARGTAAATAFRSGDTVIILRDPAGRACATLLETSMWETAIAPAQNVDFRNFAHGRHVWLARNPNTTFMLPLASAETRPLWAALSAAMPPVIRSAGLDLANAGRADLALGIAAGLGMIAEMGRRTGIDPGRPGRGDFAPAMYDDASLLQLARELGPGVRHKHAAVLAHDVAFGDVSLCETNRERVAALRATTFTALALDYDGTIVATEERFKPPRAEILSELTRLLDAGLRIGIATGRGGSAGEALRATLPDRVHGRVIVGYYNGGHILPLETDLDTEPPSANEALAAVAAWLDAEDLLDATAGSPRQSPVQLTVDHRLVRDPATFAATLARSPGVADGTLRLLSSRHSFDIIPAASTKTTLVERLLEGEDGAVLCVGDSGAEGGNDHELLGQPHAISVDAVCGRVGGTWSLFGSTVTGPDALLRILRSLRPEGGQATIDIETLGLDGL